jgi:hypothetical protein
MMLRLKIWLAAVGAVIVAVLAAFYRGKAEGKTDAIIEEQDDYIETRKRMDAAANEKRLRDDADLDREWLRSRGE